MRRRTPRRPFRHTDRRRGSNRPHAVGIRRPLAAHSGGKVESRPPTRAITHNTRRPVERRRPVSRRTSGSGLTPDPHRPRPDPPQGGRAGAIYNFLLVKISSRVQALLVQCTRQVKNNKAGFHIQYRHYPSPSHSFLCLSVILI